jgi:hypothetical protein
LWGQFVCLATAYNGDRELPQAEFASSHGGILDRQKISGRASFLENGQRIVKLESLKELQIIRNL